MVYKNINYFNISSKLHIYVVFIYYFALQSEKNGEQVLGLKEYCKFGQSLAESLCSC